MAEFLTPRMPEEDGEPASQVPLPPGRFGDPDAPGDAPAEPAAAEPVAAAELAPVAQPAATPATAVGTAPVTLPRSGPGSLWRLISLIVSVGLAWAIVVATTAWLLGLFLTRG